MMNIPVDPALKDICRDIVEKNWTEEEWATLEDKNCFKSSRYFGGFSAEHRVFRFFLVDRAGGQVPLQFSLADAPRILSGEIPEIPVLEPDPRARDARRFITILVIAGILLLLRSLIFEDKTRDPEEERKARARKYLDDIAEPIERLRNSSGDLPELKSVTTPPDPWGTPYRVILHADSFEVSSAGPDKEFGTEDDIK